MGQSMSVQASAATSGTDVSGHRQVAAWLFACCALVFAMVVVGGITRLTHSGLSMVEWQPIVGTIPPLDAAQWQEVFEKYQQTPEYRKVNRGMSLAQFKSIFWWEYFHRLLGRAIGVVFFVPFLYFIVRGRLDRRLAPGLIGILLLGALQGALGWYMVASGLVDDPRVSQYRLTAHLGMAFLIFAAMFSTALGLVAAARSPADSARRRLRRYALSLSALIFLMVLSGGMVAGIRAGLSYNTFPLMNGHMLPPEYLMLQPWWSNLFNNMAAVQFNHRLIAWLLFILIPLFWLASRKVQLTPRARLACDMLPPALALQITLGISTLLLVVPVSLAAAHQAGAMLLFSTALWASHELR
ncbi:MAG TPA: COX15/CtaA family protein [Burkholderiales bacterium]|nr:COX15/CtaA family protein [Burkholderiales bacterium]